MQELWRPVVAYEGLYEVSDQGRVKSVLRVVACGDGRTRTFQGKLLRPWLQQGYESVYLSKDGKRNHASVHILVAAAFLGQRPAGLDVLHGENGQLDNSLRNLRYGTPVENMADKLKDGTDNRGEKHGMSKLTVKQVRQIRSSLETAPLLADRFGVSKDAIVSVRLRRTWAWLDDR